MQTEFRAEISDRAARGPRSRGDARRGVRVIVVERVEHRVIAAQVNGILRRARETAFVHVTQHQRGAVTDLVPQLRM